MLGYNIVGKLYYWEYEFIEYIQLQELLLISNLNNQL